MHTGERQTEGGRVGRAAARGLSAALSPARACASAASRRARRRACTATRRLRARARRSRATIRPSRSRSARRRLRCSERQALCWLTATNAARPRAHPREPAPQPDVLGTDPRRSARATARRSRTRSCGSPTRTAHTLFLEPDGWDAEEIYVNGLSTSLPEEVQRADPRARFPALTRARMIRPGYAVEYDFVFPDQLRLDARGAGGRRGSFWRARSTAPRDTRRRRRRDSARASTRRCRAGEEPFVLERSRGLRGGHVDDLTKKGLEEPYRLFTSRAEYRLLLGVDTVLPRLLPHGRRLGLISRGGVRCGDGERKSGCGRPRGSPRERVLNPTAQTRALLAERLGIELDSPTTSFYKLLQRQDLDVERAALRSRRSSSRSSRREERSILETRVRYEGYIRRERERLEACGRSSPARFPKGFGYAGIPGLSREVVEKCSRRRPRTVGEASRIPGVTPAAVAIISAHVARGAGAAPPERFEEAPAAAGVRLSPCRGRSRPRSRWPATSRSSTAGGARSNLTGHAHGRGARGARSRIRPGSEANCSWCTGCRHRLRRRLPGLPLAIARPDLSVTPRRAARQAGRLPAALRPAGSPSETSTFSRARIEEVGGQTFRCRDDPGGRRICRRWIGRGGISGAGRAAAGLDDRARRGWKRALAGFFPRDEHLPVPGSAPAIAVYRKRS